MHKRSTKYVWAAVLIGCFLMMAPGLFGQKMDQGFYKSFNYREIGPTRQSGRFVDFAWTPKDPKTFYAATASGHLWKTMDNGYTWTVQFDNEKVFSIGDVAVAPSDPNIVWVGTGEANNSRSSYWGNGMHKSENAGKTWAHMGLDESHHIGAIEMHPTNPDILYVAALGHLYSENPERGLYKTTDGGQTWTKVLDVVIKGKNIGVVDCVMDPSDPEVLYAATFDKVRKPYSYNLGGPGSRIYKTLDGGGNWTKLGGGLPEGMLGRIGLSIYRRDPKIVYACVENANKPDMSEEDRYQELLADKASRGMIDGEIYRSDDAGATWTKVNADDQNIGGGPGYYYGQIVVDPNDDKVVHVLSAASWGTFDAGKTWKRRPLGFGGDDHCLWIDPEDSEHMLIGYDHGMGVTWDGGKNWYHPDNQSLAQFYAVGVDNSYPYRVAGGLQDNGSHMGPSTKRDGSSILLEDWDRVGGGDGMYNVFDWKTNRFLYNESQFGPLSRLDLLTGERKSIAYRQDRDMRWNWNSPIHVSWHDSNVIYHCGNKVMRSPFRGEYWEVISPDLTTNNPDFLTTGKGGDGNIQYCTITAFDESPLDANVLWVGTDDGNVQVTLDMGKNWSNCNDAITGNPGYWVSRVAASNFEPGTAYVSYTGYRRDDFRAFVYRTTDFGKTWTSIASNLPAEPVNVIQEHAHNPNLLFAGTEFGVYVSIDGGQNWTQMKNNMPTQPVHDLKIHPRENDLVVATHGRGIYIADIFPLQEVSAQLLEQDAYLFDIESKIKWINNSTPNSSSANFAGQSEPLASAIYYYLKDKPAGDVKITVYQGHVQIAEIKGSTDSGINKVYWNWDIRKERSEAEKEQMQAQMARFREMGFQPRGRQFDPNYVSAPAPEGTYTVVLTVGEKKFKKKAQLLQDHWLKPNY